MKRTYLAWMLALNVGCALPWDSSPSKSSSSSSSGTEEGSDSKSSGTSASNGDDTSGSASSEVQKMCEKLAPSGCITACKQTGSCFKGDTSLVKWIECEAKYSSLTFHDEADDGEPTYCSMQSFPSDSTADKAIAKNRKRVFVTQDQWKGSLDGATPDALCDLAATAGELGGSWKSFIAYGGEEAMSRVEDVAGGWFNVPRSVRIFANRAALASAKASSTTSQLRDEMGGVSINDWWVGSATASCSNWTNESTDSAATGRSTASCYNTLSLLCVEQ